jgi:hypothetical protein
VVVDKSEESRSLIIKAILANDLFKNLDSDQLAGIVDAMHRVEVKSHFITQFCNLTSLSSKFDCANHIN